MRRSEASSSAPARNGVTSGSHNPSTIVLLLGVSRRTRTRNKKTPSEPAGPLRSSRVLYAKPYAARENAIPRAEDFFAFSAIRLRMRSEEHTSELQSRLH